MRFQALGPISVVRDGESVDLGTHKQRTLFALLLINHNTVVSTDQILDALWDEAEASDRKSALQVYVSRLRSALEPDRVRGESSILQTKDPGYMLTVDPSDYDVAEFLRLTDDAQEIETNDPAAASELLAEALSLWQGSAFEEFPYEEFTQPERSRLEDARIGAIEARIAADLAIGMSGELVSELETLREQHPLRERLVSHQMLALYRAGRPADALRSMARFRAYIGEELGLDPTPTLLRLEEQILLHDDRIQGKSDRNGLELERSTHAVNPYMGLQSFDAEHAPLFFGRDTLIAELLRAVGSGEPLIALVGASGSGKSSVIRAGLLPVLAKGAVPGSDSWLIASMTPGGHPFAELEAALLRTTINAPASLSEQLQDPDAGILRSVFRVLPDESSRLVLVIDQFEELFTMVEDADVRMRFLNNLVTAIDDPHNRLTVIVTLRADFYGRPLEHPKFGARLGSGVVNVTALTSEELEAAAVKPALEAGVQFEPSLLGQLIADVGNQPGALPLFQFALTELFDRRSGDSLMTSTYRAMGGVEGALQRRADDLFENLSDGEQNATRQLFLRLVSVSEHDQRSRRRVEAREIASLGLESVEMQSAIAKLGEHRLLSFDSDQLSGAPTVEVAHESLLTAWPMLEAWIDESREDLRRHGSLLVGLREWQLAHEADAYLLPAARLAEFRDWERTSSLQLNDAELGYLDASTSRLQEEEASRELERLEAAKGRRRLLTLVAVLGASLAGLGLFMAGVFAPDPGPTVTFFGQLNPARVDDSIKSGLDRADAELDMVLDDVRWTIDLEAEFETLADREPRAVIVDSTVPFVPSIFFEHSDIHFGFVDPADDTIASLPNISYVDFRNDEGAFLAGVAAASTSETGVVGFVGGMRIDVIEEFRTGFEAGARAVDPDVEVLATFVSQFGGNGFTNPGGGDARATALYDRGADVVFHAAGFSGEGVFRAAERFSDADGTHVWAIGVDVDQWFDLPAGEREHVLTSMIKRADIGAYRLAEHMMANGPSGEVGSLGVGDGSYDYATTGDHMSARVVEALDSFVAEMADGRIQIPAEPSGTVLVLDNEGDEFETVGEPDGLYAPDFDEFSEIAPGNYDVTALGTPLSVEIVGDWFVQVNMLGHTTFSHPESNRFGDRDVVFLRPVALADPVEPRAPVADHATVDMYDVADLDGFEGWTDQLMDGIISVAPSRVELAGRNALYFETEIDDSFVCGTEGYCAGFLINHITSDVGISGWSFERGFHSRIWVVDGGEHPPLVILATTPSNDRSFQADADSFLNFITIGEPAPHPIQDARRGTGR